MSTISIGICAYNEERNIGRLLETLSKQCGESNVQILEIVVVASGCTDKTPDIVDSARQKNKRIRLVKEKERRGKSTAVNVLIREFQGEILVMMGADVLPAQGSIEKLLKPFNSGNVGGTTGHPIPVNSSDSPFAHMVNLIWNVFHEIAGFETRKGTFFHLSGELCALRREALTIIPTKVINDDTYLGWKAKTKDWKIVYVPDAVVHMKAPSRLTDFYRQRKRVVQGHLQIHQLGRLHISTISPFVLPRFVLRCLCLSPQGILSAALASIIETLAHLTARRDLIRGNLPNVWPPVESTKRLGDFKARQEFQGCRQK